MDLVSPEGTVVTCHFLPSQSPAVFRPGQRTKVQGKFSDFLQDSEGKWMVVMKNCRQVD